MISKSFTTLALSGFAALSLGSLAFAGGTEAGSLLVYPYFSNTRADKTILTVTNTNLDSVTGGVNVEFVYIDGDHCLEFNRTRTLTAGDTLSVVTKYDNPNFVEGYAYVFAKSKTTGKAIKFDWLVGSAMVTNGALNDPIVGYTPFTFKAGAALAAGANTDLENAGAGDGQRDFDGLEYEKTPDTLIVPSFFADDGNWEPELVMLGLTGLQFTTIINFLIYNDNEEVFSAQYTIDCWAIVELEDISNVFENSFLLTTNQNLTEVFTGTTNPNALPETGWFSLTGVIANSTAASVANPSILALLLNQDDDEGAALLPYWQGTRSNGDLLNLSIFPGS
jgi:hypothetical protein